MSVANITTGKKKNAETISWRVLTEMEDDLYALRDTLRMLKDQCHSMPSGPFHVVIDAITQLIINVEEVDSRVAK